MTEQKTAEIVEMTPGKIIGACGPLRAAAIALSASAAIFPANAQVVRATETIQVARSFPLSDLNDLTLKGGKAEIVEYQGRPAVRLTTESSEEVFAFLKGVQMQDGTIEADVAVKITTPPGVRMPGFLGIAFRARTDASHCEMFYLRPGNSHAEDQAMRNHSVQYVSAPGFDWYKLRREWPSIYESYAELSAILWYHSAIRQFVSRRRYTLGSIRNSSR